MGIVRNITTVKSKLEDWGEICMFLGYGENNTGGTYRMLNLQKKYNVLSRDAI